jgi:hypothetical protein
LYTNTFTAEVNNNTVQAVVTATKTAGAGFLMAGGLGGSLAACKSATVSATGNKVYQSISNSTAAMVTSSGAFSNTGMGGFTETRNIVNALIPANAGSNGGLVGSQSTANCTLSSITESYWSTTIASGITADRGYTAGVENYGKNNTFLQISSNFGAGWNTNWNVVNGSIPMLK